MTMENFVSTIQDLKSIIAAVQFGSSISGDTYRGSDVDIMVVVGKDKEKWEKEIRGKLEYEHQLHIYTNEELSQALSKGEPLALSIIHTGKPLHGAQFIKELQKYKPNEYTVHRCMLNSFAALGLAISDYLHGLFYDDVINSLYHAARSSIWATLMMKEITPPNRRIMELLDDEIIKKEYQNILVLRGNIPDYETDFDLERKIWQNENEDFFTDVFKRAHLIIKTNYQKITGYNFIDFFEVMDILRKEYALPQHYSVFLSVDWDKSIPAYHVMLSHEKTFTMLRINGHDGSIIEKTTKEKEAEEKEAAESI